MGKNKTLTRDKRCVEEMNGVYGAAAADALQSNQMNNQDERRRLARNQLLATFFFFFFFQTVIKFRRGLGSSWPGSTVAPIQIHQAPHPDGSSAGLIT